MSRRGNKSVQIEEKRKRKRTAQELEECVLSRLLEAVCIEAEGLEVKVQNQRKKGG